MIVKELTTKAIDLKQKDRVWVLGDMNARVGELPNHNVNRVSRKRESEDTKTTARGKAAMEELNKSGLWLINGMGTKAGITFSNYRGDSCIDYIWCSKLEDAEKGCKEWLDAMCSISDHALVATETESMGPLCRREQPRKLGWKRRPKEEWRTQTERVWWSWCHQHPSKSVEELWGSWKHTFDDSAKRWVGKAKGKRTNHWEGVWDMEMQYWSKQKNWKRKQGLDHKFEKRQLRRRKRQLARLRRKARCVNSCNIT